MKINNVVAIVTGGASGLGEASVRAIVENGGRAMVLDRNIEAGNLLSDELGNGVIFFEADVTNEVSTQEAIDKCVSYFGYVNVVINCAGIAVVEKTVGKDGPHSLASFEKAININILGSFNVSRLTAVAMQKNDMFDESERGIIINTASVAAFDGQKGQVAYAASKGGIASLTLPMARDLAQMGVRVMAIAPGLFMTPMLAGLPPKTLETLSTQPLFPNRLGGPEEFADLAMFIIKAGYLNAEVIRLDGGIRLP